MKLEENIIKLNQNWHMAVTYSDVTKESDYVTTKGMEQPPREQAALHFLNQCFKFRRGW